jgi:hypothetical protein
MSSGFRENNNNRIHAITTLMCVVFYTLYYAGVQQFHVYRKRPLSYKYIAEFPSVFSVYYNYTSVFSDLFRSIINLHTHFIIIGVQSIRSITSINTIISWKFWNENAPYE